MEFRMSARMLGLGIALASITAFVAPIPSRAQATATCSGTTQTFLQAVGFPAAPVLVPMNLPVTVCTLPSNVQVIIPAFQLVGGPAAPVIVPRSVPVASCASGFVASPSISTIPFVQVVTVTGSTVVVISSATPVTIVTPLITCF